MVDENYIKDAANKFGVSLSDAHHILTYINTNDVPASEVPVIISIAKSISKEKGIKIGNALYEAERTLHGTKMISKKKNLSKDRHDTTILPKGRPKFETREWVDTAGNVKKEKYIVPTTFIPVYSVRKSLGEKPSTRKLPPPKYYYYDVDGNFIHDAEDPPTKDPSYRIDKAKHVPFIQMEVVHLVQASKYPKPAYDENGLVIKGIDGQPMFKKDHGERMIRLSFFVGDTFIKAIPVRMDYENDVEFRIYMGNKLRQLIQKELNLFMHQYGSLNKNKYKVDLEKRKREDEYAEYYGEPPTKVRSFMNLFQQKADEKRYRDQDLLNPPKRYKKVDDKYLLEERKKSHKKVKATRKKIVKRTVKKKPVKRPIKKCICKKTIRKGRK